LNIKLGWPREWTGRFGEDKSLVPAGHGTQFLGRTALSPITIPTQLSRLVEVVLLIDYYDYYTRGSLTVRSRLPLPLWGIDASDVGWALEAVWILWQRTHGPPPTIGWGKTPNFPDTSLQHSTGSGASR
jgi:hypothetical protein